MDLLILEGIKKGKQLEKYSIIKKKHLFQYAFFLRYLNKINIFS